MTAAPTRMETITRKIGREATGLNGSVYAHVEIDAARTITAVRFSYKWKDSGTLDGVLAALGVAVTDIARDLAGAGGRGPR